MSGEQRLSGLQLKLIAVVSMLADHTAIALSPWMAPPVFRVLRAVGRMALPLFCFLLVEGFLHTRSRPRYLGGFLLFAALSELPSDLLFRGWARRAAGTNIFVTLALGLLCLMLTDGMLRWMEARAKPLPGPKLFWVLWAYILPAAACSALALPLKAEYGHEGVLMISMIFAGEALFYRGREDLQSRLVGAALAVALWLVVYDVILRRPVEGFGLGAAVFILLYSGERGKYPLPKWFFYGLYPAHLFFLLALRRLLT